MKCIEMSYHICYTCLYAIHEVCEVDMKADDHVNGLVWICIDLYSSWIYCQLFHWRSRGSH